VAFARNVFTLGLAFLGHELGALSLDPAKSGDDRKPDRVFAKHQRRG
jgi:hypothetical protein